MEDNEKLSYRRLQQQSYRSLQQLAKSLDLPSNFKKMYLVELIQAKKFKSQADINNIIRRVKLERLQLSRTKRENKRKRTQYTELPSTSNTIFSPPITQTPKRLGNMYLECSPEFLYNKNTRNYNPKRNLMHTLSQNSSSSDRVLRSFNMKTIKPNYALLSGQEVKPRVEQSKATRIKIVANGGFPHMNVTAKCVVKRHKPNILHNSIKRPLMLTDGSDLLNMNNPMKRRRTLSGIYPLLPEIPKEIHTESVCLRKTDGSLTKLNAIVQKNLDLIPTPKNNYRNAEIDIQDDINGIDDNFIQSILTESNMNNNNYLQIQYPMSSIENGNNDRVIIDHNINNNNLDLYSVYYHKKIRAEQIRCQKMREGPKNERLPRINDVFSRFNNVHRIDLTQPLYVQVSTESERSQSYCLFSNKNQFNTIMLETIYTFKNQLITNAPLLQIATTSNTKCVYTTPLITTPIAQPSTVVSNDDYISSCVVDERNREADQRLYEYLQFPEQNAIRNYYQQDDFNTSTSSLDTTQDMSSGAMPGLTDALEIISQDGDYMDQFTSDARVQCLLCSWAGPKVTLEYHIRKEHAEHIQQQYASACSVSWSLGALASRAAPRLVEHAASLYWLRARYRDPDCMLVGITSISTETEVKFGSITIYNRISGEPFSWSGHIQPSANFTWDSGNCLKIELSRLDLLPNSANLKLLNRELVSDSPSNAVVGQPMLNDIHLILYVKIFN